MPFVLPRSIIDKYRGRGILAHKDFQLRKGPAQLLRHRRRYRELRSVVARCDEREPQTLCVDGVVVVGLAGQQAVCPCAMASSKRLPPAPLMTASRRTTLPVSANLTCTAGPLNG